MSGLKIPMLTKEQAYQLAEEWAQAWNAHDLDAILSHYDEDVVLISPIAAKILNESSGIVNGKQALRSYFQKGLNVYPDLKFEILDVLWGLSSLVLYYVNQRGIKAGEFMEVNSAGKIIKVMAHYNG